ncbi:Bacterial sugar transferase [hydrothermal vent metagenome]|jgi:exopolysaccharide biosynthesis polyprenyl glycosylphosphotransferase|uniref:Bacterial sugar transferase n=1 Tax=hydrothermal vent metagenome TaxID=652676 RepID=A0A3B0QYZ4_9ZZZZ
MSPNKRIHFEISERKVLLRFFDIIAVLIGLYAVGYSFEFDYFKITKEYWFWSLILSLYLTVFGTIFELYNLKQSSKLDTTFKNIVLTVSITVLFYLLTPIVTPVLPDNRLQIIYFYLAIVGSIFLWRIAYTTFISSPRFYKRVLVLGEISNVENIVKTFSTSDPNYKIVGFINSDNTHKDSVKFTGLKEYKQEELQSVIKKEGISEIIIAINDSDSITPQIYSELTILLEQGFTIREYTQVFEEITKRVPVQFVGKDFYKYFPFSRSNQNKLYMFYHRGMDIFCSVIGILCGIILLPLVIIGNLIGNRGSLFYTQKRIGKHGKPFTIIKLRTMIKNAEKGGAKWADKNDSRVTSFGRFLRNTRLDEIPQFINILKGEMSIIGPRPERPFFVNELSKIIPFYETRHTVKPGLSGWAQVNSKYGSSIEDSLIKLQYDLFYIKHRSFFLDINIIVKTLNTMIYYRGQ